MVIPVCIHWHLVVCSSVMVSIPETRELLLLLVLIAGFSISMTFIGAVSSAVSLTPGVDGETPGVFPTAQPLSIANPVVHIHVPEHNIFAPNT